MTENMDTSKCDVIINHRVGCQVIYLLFGLMLAAMGVIYIIFVHDKTWQTWVIAPLMVVSGLLWIYWLISTFIKERVKKIPAMVVTSKSLILSGKKNQINEIPFSVIESFGSYRRRRGRSSATYLTIRYKDEPVDEHEHFDRVEEIDLGGLNMMSHKLVKLLQERLAAYNQRQI